MANHTTGLPNKGEFPENIQTVTDDIMKALEYHPLSLANVGMSIIGSRATDANHWREMEEDRHALLDDDTLEKYPLCYDKPYNLTVGASMMIMVECVPAETLQLLYLIALLEVPVSERIVKLFYQSTKTTKFDYRYSVQLKDLEDRSLVELTMQEGKRILVAHGLRIHYIREKRYCELRSLAAQILGERTGSLFAIMAAMHFAQPFLDLVTIQLEDHIRVINNGVIPRRMESGRDASALVTQIRSHSHWICPLFGILNLGGISDWEHQVRDCATRIILNFICNEELDNDSLARLPETISTIRTGRFRDKSGVSAFGVAVLEIACDRRRAFSADDVPPEKNVLLDWVWQNLSEGRLLSTVDQRIVDYDKYWMEVALKVGLLCAHPDPLTRPSMQSVLHMFAGDVAVPSIATFYPARFSSELEIFSYGLLHGTKSGGVSKLGEKPRKFSYKQLSVATRAFSTETKIGGGGFGSVHHGVLPSSRIQMAVKNMEIRSSQHEKQFMAELSIISQLRHPNLIKLQGWCKDASRGKQLLVYELMPNGSLDKALFETGESEIGCLSWPQRFNIVTGIAGALHYLHHGWKHQIIHRDIKSSNILLDKEWNAKLGDFGLARLVDHQTIAKNTMVIGTYGYIAPEATYGTFTEKSDVFASGAVLLEIACGRKAFLSGAPVEEAVLVNWVWQSVSEGALLRTVDKRLGVYDMHWMEVLLMVGLLCSHPDPLARPSMRHVVQVLAGVVPVRSVPASKPTPPAFQRVSFNVLHVPKSGGTYVLHGQKSESTRKLEGMTKIFSHQELSVATRAFSGETIIGAGGASSVHYGVLPSSGIPVAVKRVDNEKDFEREVTALSEVRHQNVVELQGWCRGTSKGRRGWRKDASEGKFFIVYELMANSSLDKVLYGFGKHFLSLPQRLKIVTDIAAALNYLHHGWKQTVIHRDIKPANIMLDEQWHAKLGDFGLAVLTPHGEVPCESVVAGTPGYMPPEVFQSDISTKSDVFAFGIVVLEVACGRWSINRTMPEEEVILVNWVSQKLSEGALLSTVDKRLGNYDEHWMKMLLTIGLMCSANDPLARPSMADVLQILSGDCPVPSIAASKPEILIQTLDETRTQRKSKDKGKKLAEPNDSTSRSSDCSSDSSPVRCA